MRRLPTSAHTAPRLIDELPALSETDWRKVVPRAVDRIRRRLIQLDKDGTLRVQNFDPADAR